MNKIISQSFRHVVALILVFGFSQSLHATIIDNTPPNFSLAYFDFTGPDIAGGTFFADDTVLNSFTLNVVQNNAGGTFSAVVMSVAGGIPDSLLWSSGAVAIPAIEEQMLFNPDLGLSVGVEYFIGIDTGQLTGASGSVSLGFTNDNIAGQHWENLNAGNWSSNNSYDISSRIVMSNTVVPEPTTLALMGIGLLAVGVVRRRARH